MNPIAIAIFFSFLLFIGTWIWSTQKDNYSIVDAVWASGFAAIAAIYLFYSDLSVPKIIYAMMVLIWSARLGLHLFSRILGNLSHEDIRYVHLRESFKDRLHFKFFLFFMVQAVSQILLSIPLALYLYRDVSPEVQWNEIVGFILFPISVFGEGLADRQLKDFKAYPSNHGRVCDRGLWNYSRHPNYFFEFLIWVAFMLPALSAPHGYYAVIAPALMLFLLLKVSGVPLNEELSIKSKGQAYRDYMKTTSAFIPLPKKRDGG